MPEREHEQIDFEDELRKAYDAKPFAPFDILTASGDSYYIDDPGRIAFGNIAIVVVLPKTGVQIVRKNQITAIHLHELV